jgi:hypothetical protein
MGILRRKRKGRNRVHLSRRNLVRLVNKEIIRILIT